MAVRKNRSPVFECIATSLEDALAIEQFGGQRIELVSALSQGGFTPNEGLIKAVLDHVRIPVAVILRPNKVSFRFSPNDLLEMKNDIQRFGQLGVRHVVTGMLDEDGIADIKSLEMLLLDTNLTVTFHRAIDQTSNIELSLQRINNCKRVTHILTSLGWGAVIDNLDRLEWYTRRTRTRLILASGITHRNVPRICQAARQFGTDIHIGTALRHGDAMKPVDPFLVEAMAGALGIK
ncbi:MAG: copper homeostasis protein CutC [Clostridiaceae bacterium]|nr:copper homeostasis protein CutC [Clostridiaceae bacterium]